MGHYTRTAPDRGSNPRRRAEAPGFEGFAALLLGLLANLQLALYCDGVIPACFDPQADGEGHDPEWLYFAVDDLEATFEARRKAGVRFLEGGIHGTAAGEIHRRPWGERSFYMYDPFGNGICVVDQATMFTAPRSWPRGVEDVDTAESDSE